MIARYRPAMDRNDPAAALQVFLEVLPVIAHDVSCLRCVEDDDIRFRELFLGGKSIATRGLRAALVEQSCPVLEEGWIVVTTRCMRFFTRADEDAERLSTGDTQREED